MISRVMWLIKGNHRHLKAEVLSEYLDGRLEGAALARAERGLAECSVCREDLDSLQATVAAIRRLPVEAPARDFVMAAPPFRPARPRPTPLARASMWAYAGAASVAALVLTVLASADATGLLAPSQPGFDESSTAAFDAPVSMEDYQSDAAAERAEAFDDSMEMAEEEAAATTAPLITAEPVAEMELAEATDDSMEMADEGAAASEPPATAEPMAAEEPSVAFDDPEVMADGDDAGAATLETDAAIPAMDDAGAMAYDDAAAVDSLDTDDAMAMEPEAAVAAEDAMPEDAPADDAIIRSQAPEELEPVTQAASEAITEAPAPTAVVQVTQADGDAMAVAEDAPAPTEPLDKPAPADEDAPDEERRVTPSPQPAVVALTPSSYEAHPVLPVLEEDQTLEEAASDLDPGPQEPGTALYWRILQGIAGALALLFLAAFAVKWRASRVNGAARG